MFKDKNTTILNYISTKSKNNFPIRVLYKKTNKIPEVKIIPSVKKLKKAIVERNLEIIPYENVFIICFKQDLTTTLSPNIVLPLKSIYGDFILVRIDKTTREFKGLTQKDIIWYTQDLINKSSLKIAPTQSIKNHYKNYTTFYEKGFERDSNTTAFDYNKEILNKITTIELMLKKLLKDGDLADE